MPCLLIPARRPLMRPLPLAGEGNSDCPHGGRGGGSAFTQSENARWFPPMLSPACGRGHINGAQAAFARGELAGVLDPA